jgi:L-arabinose isomerase
VADQADGDSFGVELHIEVLIHFSPVRGLSRRVVPHEELLVEFLDDLRCGEVFRQFVS